MTNRTVYLLTARSISVPIRAMKSVNQDSNSQMFWVKGTFATLSRVLATASGLDELLLLLIRQVVETTSPADAGTLYLYNNSRQQLLAEA